MIEKIESYKTKDGMIFPKRGVKEIIVYVTEDGETFTDEGDADTHLVKLKNKRKSTETIKKIKQLFEQELVMFADNTDIYKGVSIESADLECDFWDAVSQALTNEDDVDVTIEDFEDYMLIVKALLKNLHLEETIKIVKKMMCNLTEETV